VVVVFEVDLAVVVAGEAEGGVVDVGEVVALVEAKKERKTGTP
jgi:translation elongation factor EF-Tu-like GTPase